ncbi:MAG: GyrI-like domain-containing protein, partial [Planctomycetota bacterium]
DWDGEVVGAGQLEHLELNPGKSIRDEIRFFHPMKSISKVGFDFKPTGDGTEVTWSMSGSLPFFLFWMTGQIETFVGLDYERGLSMLKEWIETGKVSARTEVIGPQAMGPFHVLGVRDSCTMKDTGASMEKAITKARSLLESAGLEICGEILTVYHRLDMKKQVFDYTSGFMFDKLPSTIPEGMSQWSLPNCTAFRVDHHGSYHHLGNSWSAANQHVRNKKMKPSKIAAFELYKNDPGDTPPEELLTEIYLPLK